MYVSKLLVKNWRNFTAAEAHFGETTYLIGPNASGKSNFLDIFRFLRDIANPSGGGLQQAVSSRGGLTKIRSLAARRSPRVEIEVDLVESLDEPEQGPDWKYILSIKSGTLSKRRVLVDREEVYHQGELVLRRPLAEDKADEVRLTQTHLEQINVNREFRDVAHFLEGVLYLHLVPQLLKHGDEIGARRMQQDPFGQGFLEAVASTQARTRESRLKRIEEILQRVIPHFRELRFLRDEITGVPHLEMRYVHWRPKAGWQREDQFSDGTLRLIAMIWTLLSSNSFILLEEPELSLHKSIVEQIPEMIYRAKQSTKRKAGQILVSTHSMALLASKSIGEDFLIVRPGEGGESSHIDPPSQRDLKAMESGMAPADVLLPQTSSSIGRI
jgi:predicted ATPase